MFNIQSFSDTSLDASEARAWRPQIANGDSAAGHTHGASCEATCVDRRPLHDTSITSTLIPLPALTDGAFDRLNDFLESVLWTDKLPYSPTAPKKALSKQGVEVLRTKGLLRRTDGREYVLQGVTDIFELKEATAARSDGAGKVEGKIVLIGRRVDVLRDALTEHLGL